MEARARFRQETPKDMPTHPAQEAFRDLPRIGSGWVAFAGTYLAIAITLLVLEIKIEPPGFSHLWRALAEEWPAYLAYVTSFLTIGGVWLAHHALFERLRAPTRPAEACARSCTP
jgi:hypothetical protein